MWFTPSHRRNRAVAREEDSEFDREWGVDTSGTLEPGRSEVVGPNWLYGGDYQGICASTLYEALSDLSIQCEQFTFLDFGSGKGRAILTASRFPFRNVIGVEYSEHLNETARRNVSRFPKAEKKCKLIDVICADAATFPIPHGPLVIFLYNPFGRQVMGNVVNNVLTSFQRNPRRIIVLYFNAVFADVWKNAGFLQEIRASEWNAIYDTQVHNASGSS
jgi:SAM-dependent methyltransferase